MEIYFFSSDKKPVVNLPGQKAPSALFVQRLACLQEFYRSLF